MSDTQWTASPFTTDVERRPDGTLLLRPRAALRPYRHRMADALVHWAATVPTRTLIARRGSDGRWIRISYAQMLYDIRRLGAGLIARRLSADKPLVILSGNSLEHLSIALAANYVGVPYCAVSPAYSHSVGELSRLRQVFELLTPGLIAAFDTARFARAIGEVVSVETEIVGDSAISSQHRFTMLTDLASQPDSALEVLHARTGPQSIVKFVLTSGSVGPPKAVIVNERMLCSNAAMLCEAMPFLVDECPVLVDWLPWSHIFGGSHNIGLTLLYGGTLYIDDGKPTPAGFGETLRNLREISPTVYFNVPTGFDLLAGHLARDEALRGIFYARIRACFFAAASLPHHTWDVLDAAARLARGKPVPILSSLGATETGPAVTFTTPSSARSGVIGLPAAGNEIKLAPEEGKFEIRVRSPSITPGYWRRPELTAAAFDEEGYYRMGDAVRLVDESDPTQGMVFDGRLAEDFKLATGTWVSVGRLRTRLIAMLSPYIQDIVIAGINRDYLTAILIPDQRECSRYLGCPETLSYEELSRAAKLLALLGELVTGDAAVNSGSSMHIKKFALLRSPLSFDRGEITEKGSVNQRAVLASCREAIIHMYEATEFGST